MATIWVAISLFLFDIAGLASHLRLKLCGELTVDLLVDLGSSLIGMNRSFHNFSG